MSRPASALLLTGLLLTGPSLTGCSGTGERAAAPVASAPTVATTAPSATPTPAKPVPPPANRACYRLTYDDALAPTTGVRASRCTREHTARTFFVGGLDTVVDGHLVAVDSRRVRRQVSRECPARLARFLGGSVEQRRLSMLRAVWFTPTVQDSDAGATWFRCDVAAVAGERRLAALTGRLAGVLDTAPGRDRYAMCGTAEPGTPRFRRVICSRNGAVRWRALRTVPFRPGPYPGEERVRGAGAGPCEEAGRAAAEDPLDFRWGYEWPRPEQWAHGQTYGICWGPV